MDNLPLTKLLASESLLKRLVQHWSICPPTPRIFPQLKTAQSLVKEFLRARSARTYAQLDSAITDALAAVTPKDIKGLFTHCCYI